MGGHLTTSVLDAARVPELLLVVRLSTNGERALNYTIVERLILTTNIQLLK